MFVKKKERREAESNRYGVFCLILHSIIFIAFRICALIEYTIKNVT